MVLLGLSLSRTHMVAHSPWREQPPGPAPGIHGGTGWAGRCWGWGDWQADCPSPSRAHTQEVQLRQRLHTSGGRCRPDLGKPESRRPTVGALAACRAHTGCKQELDPTTSSSFGEPGNSGFKEPGKGHRGRDATGAATGISRLSALPFGNLVWKGDWGQAEPMSQVPSHHHREACGRKVAQEAPRPALPVPATPPGSPEGLGRAWTRTEQNFRNCCGLRFFRVGERGPSGSDREALLEDHKEVPQSQREKANGVLDHLRLARNRHCRVHTPPPIGVPTQSSSAPTTGTPRTSSSYPPPWR